MRLRIYKKAHQLGSLGGSTFGWVSQAAGSRPALNMYYTASVFK